MKPTPLLDFWQKPPNAGEPVALLATTFALEPEFFERDCLARFLEVSSVNEDTGSIDDLVAHTELDQLLRGIKISVLADRSAPVQRSSLLWDLLSCKVKTGLLHAKVSVLIWENATRIIIGSPNLTAAGYRRQIELALAVDLGKNCLFPTEVLSALADELDSYFELIPGYNTNIASINRAQSTLTLLRQRISKQNSHATGNPKVAFAPTNANTAPLDLLDLVWKGARPLTATHLSAFWDSHDSKALRTTRQLLNGRPAERRSHRVAVVLNPRGQVPFSAELAQEVDTVCQLKAIDTELRTLHAKCLLIESDEWIAALIGSSNHTLAGLGLSKSVRHREANVWIGAAKGSKEGKALMNLIQLGDIVPAETETVSPSDEDEVQLPALPTCFQLCEITKSPLDASWSLNLGISDEADMPKNWSISLVENGHIFAHRSSWEGAGRPSVSSCVLPKGLFPMYVVVSWGEAETLTCPWAVVAVDPFDLPPGPTIANLSIEHLLEALATNRPLSDVVRNKLESDRSASPAGDGLILDPLKRLDVENSLLKKGRALAASLTSMQHRLELRPAMTLEALKGRLNSPLGPLFVATKVVEAFKSGKQSAAEAMFTLAEISLVLARINWSQALALIDQRQGRDEIEKTIKKINKLRLQINSNSSSIALYATRAIKEARQCVSY